MIKKQTLVLMGLLILVSSCSIRRCKKFEPDDHITFNHRSPKVIHSLPINQWIIPELSADSSSMIMNAFALSSLSDLNVNENTNHVKRHVVKASVIQKKQAIKKLIAARKQVKKTISETMRNEGGGGGGLNAFGWILIILGFIVLLLVSILLGALVMLLGLIFIVSGNKGNDDTKKKETKQDMEDVLYLKNGNILRGMIIEQIPNETVKIKTKDGNVFIYKFDEILKITKEPANN